LICARSTPIARTRPREKNDMGLIWNALKTLALGFAVVIAALVIVDGTLLGNILNKAD
jgi:hypothetical protein